MHFSGATVWRLLGVWIHAKGTRIELEFQKHGNVCCAMMTVLMYLNGCKRIYLLFFHSLSPSVLKNVEMTITALFKTHFRSDFPFSLIELFIFALIGVLCGFGGAAYVNFHRRIVHFNRNQKRMSEFLQKK